MDNTNKGCSRAVQNVVTIVVALTMAAALTACVTTYEGASDYRYGTIDASNKAAFHDKFEPAAGTKDAGLFKPHDPISIYLKNAFFAWCPPHWYERTVAAITVRAPKCRVAVVVNVGSKLEQRADHGSPENPGRIVFYSRDIQPSQFINQSYGLLYSSSAWDGNDVTLDVTVLEMATEDTKTADAMLKVLASIGTSPALASGGQEVVRALNSVGSAFVRASEKDSVIGYHRFSLLGQGSNSTAYIPVLREGDLILMRARDEDRETIDWKNYVYDPAVGKIFRRALRTDADARFCATPALTYADIERIQKLDKLSDNKYCYYEAHNRNYLVFSLVKASAGGDWVPATTLATLQAAIQSSPSSIQQAAMVIADIAIQRATLHQARESLKKLKATGTAPAVKGYEAQRLAGIVQCGYVNSVATASDGLTTYAKANCGGDNWRSRSLTSSEFEYLAQELATCRVTVSAEALVGAPNDGTKAADARKSFATSLGSMTCT